MRKIVMTGLVVGAAGVLAACSSGENGSSMHGSMGSSDATNSREMKNAPVVEGARDVPVRATSFRFDPKTIDVSANEPVAIVLTATDIEHDVTVEGIGHIVHANGGKTAKGGLMIDKPGTYRFYCSVSGHRAAGMAGTIVVR